MGANEILATPPDTHVVYIPFLLIVGFIIGFVFGRQAGIKQGKAEFIGGGESSDDFV